MCLYIIGKHWGSFLSHCTLIHSFLNWTDALQIVYTNSLLATFNAHKMMRIAGEGIQTTSENLSVSLREYPKTRPMSTMVNYRFFSLYSRFWINLAY